MSEWHGPEAGRSRAVVMGTWIYHDPKLGPYLPAVKNSLNRFRGLLSSPLCGWPEDAISPVENESNPGTIPDLLMRQFSEARDVALFYYVGHGLLSDDEDPQLCLTLTGTVEEAGRRVTTSLMYSAVRRALLKSRARTKIVILDCCNSRTALPPALGRSAVEASGAVAPEFLDGADVENAYVLVAAAGKRAYYEIKPDSEGPQTYFTKYLADLIERGIESAPSILTMETIFKGLRSSLNAGGHALPDRRNHQFAAEYPFCRNAALMPVAPEAVQRPWPPDSGARRGDRVPGQRTRPSGSSEHSQAEAEDPKGTEAPPSAEISMSAGNLAAFCEQLRGLQRQAGMPTLVQLRARMGPVPGVSTLSALLRGKIRRAPRWELVSGFVTACVSHAAGNGIQFDGPEADLMTWRRRHQELLGSIDASRSQQYGAFPDWGDRPSAIAGLPYGKLYQPVLFVGLGGTGCSVGTELERALRDQICGPDGRKFTAKPEKGDMLPYQLPSCIQFVYADLNLAELGRLPGRVVPGSEHLRAVSRTAEYTTGLVPDEPGYPELAMQLRLRAGDLLEGWLPPRTKEEPNVAPLNTGAGQFPTIGRAALVSTLLNGTVPAVREIKAAVGRLAGSGADLHAMGGRLPRGVDVFVAFSAAGGTGAGIFYDYLHLIANTVERNGLRAQIHPLVLMPSAFEERLGGGRSAELNAGRALLDLFRLIDQQNRATTRRILRGSADPLTPDEDETAITYPGHERITIRPGRIQTAFLFPRPAGATRQDMYLSMASLVTSLMGSETSAEEQRLGNQPASFAESFVTGQVLVADSLAKDSADRAAAADDGIGRRGVSTALVASLTTPADQMAEIVADRLLSEAIREMSVPARTESNLQDIRGFIVGTGVDPVVEQQVGPHAEPGAAQGARNVTAALNDRLEAMRAGIKSLRTRLNLDVPQLAADFHPSRAVVELLGKYDPFRVERVVVGHQDLVDPVEQGGAEGLLTSRSTTPAAPPGLGTEPSAIPRLRDRLTRQVRWNDQEVVDARNRQDEWYEWQARATWAEFWDLQAPQWRRRLERASRELSAFTSALNAFADQGLADFVARSDQLYRKRVGVSYLLPAGSGGMGEFYENVVRRLHIDQAERGLAGADATDSELLSILLGEGIWLAMFEFSLEYSPERAVSCLREKVRTAIKTFMREEPYVGQRILPRLRDLLAQAARHGSSAAREAPVFGEYLRGLAEVLGAMLPADVAFLGTGQLRALVSYPAIQKSVAVERYLRSAINLPAGLSATDYRSTVTEAITVLLYRTGMSITQVPEVRYTAQRWAGAVSRAQPRDLLRWRQRTGYNFGYLATAEDNAAILHRFLCALWNGKGTVTGPKESPEQLVLTLPGGSDMTLRLAPLVYASSWGSLLREYERLALDGDLLHQELCKELMLEVPARLAGTPPPPAELYQVLRKLAVQQVPLSDEMMMGNQSAGQVAAAAQMRDFWTVILPAALDLEFTGVPLPHRRNLRELERAVGFTID
jgi:Tubulin like/Caspase domain